MSTNSYDNSYDLLGDDDLLGDNSSDEYYDENAINHANQDEMIDNDKKEIERLTKELNTLVSS